MSRFLALVVYGCTVGGERSESVDFQVKTLETDSIQAAERLLRSEEVHSYKNDRNEIVAWPLGMILDINPLDQASAPVEEIAGAITSLSTIDDALSEGVV